MSSGQRILVVSTVFARSADEKWLLDDLVDALLKAGNRVDVIVGDAKRGRRAGPQPVERAGLRVFSVGPRHTRISRPGRLLNHAVVGWGFWGRGRRWAALNRYDLCLYTSVASFSWGLPGHLRRRGVVESLTLILWDFFPVHQLEIGRIRASWAAPLLKLVEAGAIRASDRVALMSPANVEFFHRYFPTITARTLVVPPWSSSGDTFVNSPSPDPSRLRAVFGGQLVRGRGVETIIEAARLLAGTPVDIVIAGDGPERTRLEQLAARVDGVQFTGRLGRPEYRDLLRTAHVGLAVTVSGVSPPSFPSKIVEYCGLGLPVIVAVEPSSDAGTLVEARGAGFAVPVDDAAALARALVECHAELMDGRLAQRARMARAYYLDELSAEAAARALTEESVDAPGGSPPTSADGSRAF